MATTSNTLEYNLPQSAYATFDAQSLKSLIIRRLNESGTFTDQNFVGSNINVVSEIIALAYSNLIFYLNQTSSESLFTEARLYESMNSIVKMIGYKPVGFQTAMLNFKAYTQSLPTGVYRIPRYSYLDVGGGTFYTFTEDSSFTFILPSTITGDVEIGELGTNYVLQQGKMVEYPLITARGEEFEQITMIPSSTISSVIVDHFNIDVYVYSTKTSTWSKWKQVDSIFLESSTSTSYEARLNDKGLYEFTFGNGTNGVKLQSGDIVAIYYLESDGQQGEVDMGAIKGASLIPYNTPQYNSIVGSVGTITTEQMYELKWDNKIASTKFSVPENADSIRKYAPSVLNSGGDLVTLGDFYAFIGRTFGGNLASYKVMNNVDFVDQYVKYLRSITSDPIEDFSIANAFYQFGTSTAYNNLYIFGVPAVGAKSSDGSFAYLTTAQKMKLVDSIKQKCQPSVTPIVIDPVYIAFDFGWLFATDMSIEQVVSNTVLLITKDRLIDRDNDTLKQDVVSVIQSVFDVTNQSLGNNITIDTMVSRILSIPGVKRVQTKRLDTSDVQDGVSLAYWNPVYIEEDFHASSQTITLSDFMFGYWNGDDIASKIQIV